MSRQIEALKLALEALEAATPVKAKDPQMQADAIVALREALAEQPSQQPVSGADELVDAYCKAWEQSFTADNPYHTVKKTAEDRKHIGAGLKAALAEQPAQQQYWQEEPDGSVIPVDPSEMRPPAQQHEPVAWGWAIMHSDGTAACIRARVVDFFGAIQERESFTEEDVKQVDREWAGLAPHTIVTLYTSTQAQPAREPLTDEQQIAESLRVHGLTLVKTAGGYEVLRLGQITAHNIKENT